MGVVQASESCKLIQNKLEVKMGNSQSEPPADSNDVLVHSFQLDADVDILSLPYCYPGKQEMFHIPKNFSSHLSTFLPYELGVKTIEEINQILKETGVGSKRFNFLLILCSILLFLFFTPIVMTVTVSTEALLICPVIVYAACFALFKYNTMARKKRLLEYIHTWNKTQNNGVRISLGVTTNVRGMTDGSETGGTYEHFYMATWDPKSLRVRGFLHIFVNYQDRAAYCQQNGRPFIPPVPPHQQNVAQQIASQAPQAPQGFQTPPGYALLPQDQMPPPDFKVPAGFVLVPENHDMPPPTYEDSKQI